MNATTIGPVKKEVRDAVADFRDREGCSNYNEAVQALLRRADAEKQVQ